MPSHSGFQGVWGCSWEMRFLHAVDLIQVSAWCRWPIVVALLQGVVLFFVYQSNVQFAIAITWLYHGLTLPIISSFAVFLTVGIPTVYRLNAGTSYVKGTLESIISHTSDEEKDKIIILIFLADFNHTHRNEVSQFVHHYHQEYLDSGLIQVSIAFILWCELQSVILRWTYWRCQFPHWQSHVGLQPQLSYGTIFQRKVSILWVWLNIYKTL